MYSNVVLIFLYSLFSSGFTACALFNRNRGVLIESQRIKEYKRIKETTKKEAQQNIHPDNEAQEAQYMSQTESRVDLSNMIRNIRLNKELLKLEVKQQIRGNM